MESGWLSTRMGYLDQIQLWHYSFSPQAVSNRDKLEKLRYWLENRSGFPIYSVKGQNFVVVGEAAIPDNWQYRLNERTVLRPPYANTQAISRLLGNALNRDLASRYRQFLNEHIFVVDKLHLSPFQLLKTAAFNIEVFPSGHYLIHFQPGSKVVGNKFPVNSGYINQLRANNQNAHQTDRMEFFLTPSNGKFRKRLDLLDPDLEAMINEVNLEQTALMATFNPHFLTNYNPELYRKVLKFTHTKVSEVHALLEPVVAQLELPAFWGLSAETFAEVDVQKPRQPNNLLVGTPAENITIHERSITRYGLRVAFTRDDEDTAQEHVNFIREEEKQRQFAGFTVPIQVKAKIAENQAWKHPYISRLLLNPEDYHSRVSVQSASFYNGVYRPAHGFNFLPVMCDGLKPDILLELIATFNRGATDFKVLPPLVVAENADIDGKALRAALRAVEGRTLVLVCCRQLKPRPFFKPLQGCMYQIYQGALAEDASSRQRLSNFVCKCIEKAGGVVCAIAESGIGEGGYFIGIDLGHAARGAERFSNLAVVIFDHKGLLLGHHVVRNKQRMENLERESCGRAFQAIRGVLEEQHLSAPLHVIIHRDGRLHAGDIKILKEVIGGIWGEIMIDIVEIIKSGYPVMAKKNEVGLLENLSSGSYYCDDAARYAILVTNTQADQEKAILNPIIIKHKYGETAFSEMVEQVYWFTRVYTNNLYHSSRLPATTLKANNVVSTSDKVYQATYLG